MFVRLRGSAGDIGENNRQSSCLLCRVRYRGHMTCCELTSGALRGYPIQKHLRFFQWSSGRTSAAVDVRS